MIDAGEVVSPRLARAVEAAARQVGLPLHALELLLLDPSVAQGFLSAVARGQGREYLAALDVQVLEAALRAKARRADDDPPPGAALAV